jgi:hypothetical protein
MGEFVLPEWLTHEAGELVERPLIARDVELFYAEMARITEIPTPVLRHEGMTLARAIMDHFEPQNMAPEKVMVIVSYTMALLVSAIARSPEELIWLRELLSSYYKVFLMSLDREINADGY